jgi:hypothetical protein
MEQHAESAMTELDLRGVEPPDHILSILKKAAELPSAATLRARLDNNPMQLYDLLQQRGFTLTITRDSDGSCVALITARSAGQ